MIWIQFIVMVQQWNYFIPMGSDDSSMKRDSIDDAAIALFQEPDMGLEMIPVAKKVHRNHRNSIVINLLDQIDQPNEPINLHSQQHNQTSLNNSLNQLELFSNEVKISAASVSNASMDSSNVRLKPEPETDVLGDQAQLEQDQRQGVISSLNGPTNTNRLLCRADELTAENDELKTEIIKLKR